MVNIRMGNYQRIIGNQTRHGCWGEKIQGENSGNHFLIVGKNTVMCPQSHQESLIGIFLFVKQMLHKAWQQTNAEIGKNPISFHYFSGKENATVAYFWSLHLL